MISGMLIDGRIVESEEQFDVIDPALGTPFARIASGSLRHLDEAAAAAQRAFPEWSRTIDVRRDVLKECASLIRDDASELARLICHEQGKPLALATGEVMGSARWFEYTADLALDDEVIADTDTLRQIVRRRPLGVVAGIGPWNYPLMTIAWKIAPALLAGNCIIVKSSPFTPLATQRLGMILKDAVPAGVLALLSGGDELGRALATHPAVRKVSLTGSTEAGKSVFGAAANDLKRLTLELGGNDAAIVLDDVDVSTAIEGIYSAAFRNSGQICAAIKRLYVHDGVFDALVEGLTARIDMARVGHGLDPDTDMGPISTQPQYERVCELAGDARSNGGCFHGNARMPAEGSGFFFPPAIVTGLPDTARLVTEEQFGPLLPVMRFTDPEDALRRANDTHFGLSGSVWGRDIDRATAYAARLECGTAWVNQHLVMTPGSPVGGHKWSGMGVENGLWGLHAYTEIQTLSIAKA